MGEVKFKNLREMINDCAVRLDRDTGGMTRTNAENPYVFVLLGDKIFEAYETIKSTIEKKWNNSKNVFFFSLGTEEYKNKDKDNKNKDKTIEKPQFSIFCKKYKYFIEDYDSRIKIARAFEEDKETLKQINEKADNMIKEILSLKFTTLRKVNISICCYADDPINILLPDICVLFKNKLKEHYPDIDLFVCINDNEESPLAYAFFRELDLYQGGNFTYSKKTTAGGNFFVDTVLTDQKLFNYVYLLGKKNYNQIMPEDIDLENYKIIALINYANNESFRKYEAITSKQFMYSTVGYAYLYKPNNLIASKLVSGFIRKYFYKTSQATAFEGESSFSMLGIDCDSMIQSIRIPKAPYEEFLTVMHTADSLEDVPKMTRAEILNNIYSGNILAFFKRNIAEVYMNTVRETIEPVKNLKDVLLNAISEGKVNLATINEWLKASGSLVNHISDNVRYYRSKIQETDKEIYELIQKKPKLHKNHFNDISIIAELLIDTVKIVINREIDKMRSHAYLYLWENYESQITHVRSDFLGLAAKIDNIIQAADSIYSETLASVSHISANLERYDDYVERIINEYEMKKGIDITKTAFPKNEDTDSEKANLYELLTISNENDIIEKLYNFFRFVFFDFSSIADELINISFDEDIIARGAEQEFYNNLNEESVLNLNFLSTPPENIRYSIYMGNKESKFTSYAVKSDSTKIGSNSILITEEGRKDGLEKLNIFTGLYIQDIKYLVNCKELYNEALSIGHCYHDVDETELADFDVLKY